MPVSIYTIIDLCGRQIDKIREHFKQYNSTRRYERTHIPKAQRQPSNQPSLLILLCFFSCQMAKLKLIYYCRFHLRVCSSSTSLIVVFSLLIFTEQNWFSFNSQEEILVSLFTLLSGCQSQKSKHKSMSCAWRRGGGGVNIEKLLNIDECGSIKFYYRIIVNCFVATTS